MNEVEALKQYNLMKFVAKYHNDRQQNRTVEFDYLSQDKVQLAQICCRSNIFSATKKAQHVHSVFHHTRLGKVTIDTYVQLTQKDLDILLVLLHECSLRDTYTFTISMRYICKKLNISYGTAPVKRIKSSLSNLTKMIVEAELGDALETCIMGSFLNATVTRNGVDIDIRKSLLPLFESSTVIDLKKRLTYSNSFTKYMYNFVCSSSIPVKLDALQQISGKENRAFKLFNSDLKKAMNELLTSSVIRDWHIDVHHRLCWK